MKMKALFTLFIGCAIAFLACTANSQASLESAKAAIANVESLRYCDPSTYELIKEKYEKAQELAQKENHEEAQKNAKIAEQLSLELSRKYKKPCPDPNAVVESKNKKDEEPAIEEDQPIIHEQVEALETIYFEFDAFNLSGEAISTINQNIKWLKTHSNSKIVLRGHTDVRGSNEYNLALSEKRSKAVFRYLQSQAIDTSNIETVGYGEEQPVSFSDTESGHAKNRRVEFWEQK
jgi:outer membrane protein OmpA-like peptidoglycan-associated protein